MISAHPSDECDFPQIATNPFQFRARILETKIALYTRAILVSRIWA